MKKRALSLLMAFVMVLSLLPVTARAAEPKEITDAAGFAGMTASESYILTKDIEVSTPYAGEFTGTFDGNGHTITLRISSASYNTGLFSKIGQNGTVKNVITAGSVTGKSVTGAVAGLNYGTIQKCWNQANVKGTTNVGGIVGANGSSSSSNLIHATVTGCYNTGSVKGTRYIGGIVGNSANSTLEKCASTGMIDTTNALRGGIAGASSAKRDEITDCYWLDTSCKGGKTFGTPFQSTELKTVAGKLGSSWTTEKGTLVLEFGASEPAATISGGKDTLWMRNSGGQPYETFTVKLDGADDTGAAVTWSAEPKGLVTLTDGRDAFHKTVTACKPGKVTLTATVKAADGTEYPAAKEITVMPFINTIAIEGTPAVGKTVSARAYVLTGGPYEQTYDQIEGLPGLTYTWKKQTEEQYLNGTQEEEIAGVTGDTLTITEDLSGCRLRAYVWYNGENKCNNIPFGPIVSAAAGDLKEDASWLFDRMQPYTRAEQKADTVLPLVSAAPHGSTITWTSSDNAIIDPDTGKLTLPKTGEKPTVTLTAVLKNGGEETTRTYTITVWSEKDLADYDANLTQKLADDVNAKLGDRDVLVPVFDTDKNALTMVTAKLDREDITVTMGTPVRTNATANLSKDVVNIAENGAITYFYVDPNDGATANLQRFGTFSVPFTFARGGVTVERTFAVTVYWDRAKVESAMERDIVSNLPAVPSTATENFELPKVVNGKTWTDITWTSSDNAIYISSERQSSADKLLEPYVAVVRGSSVEKTVTLTAKLTFRYTNDVTGSEEPITLLRSYTVTVPASADGLKYQEALDAVFGEGSLTDAATGAALNLGAVKNDIQFPITGDLNRYMLDKYGEGFDGKFTPVLLTSDDAFTVREPDAANAARMAVYRPAAGKEAKTVTLTVKILDRPSGKGRDYASMPVLAEKTFRIVVKPLTQDEIDEELALMAEVKAHYWDGIKNENTAARDVTGDLAPFVEVYKQDGALVWVRDVREMRNSGIVPVAMKGWQELEAWRLFRSSNPAAVTHENLLVTQQFEGKAVTVTSALSSETLGRYGELYRKDPVTYAAYEKLADLYYQTVSAELVVRGRNTANMFEKEVMVNGKKKMRLVSKAVEEKVTVSFTLSGNGELWLGTRTLRDLDEGVTVFDVLRQLWDERVLSFEHKGGYVQSITCNGKTLAELDEGKNSGWLYTVNGELPDVYMSAYGLKNGDSIRIYFTKDYTKEPGADRWKPVTPVTKTETVTNADGSVTKIETKPDGTIIETTTKPDGGTVVAETKPDGSVSTVEKRADGTEIKTAQPVSGEITASVSVPKSVGSTRVDIPVSKPSGSMVAVIVHPDGTEEIVRGSVVTETGIALRAEGDVRLKIIDNAKHFNDMADHWAKDAVEFASSRELFNGVGNDAFGPDRSMTRGMVGTVLARLAGADTAGGETWYAKGTAWAVENGISDGTAPEQPVTREQLAAMLYRYAGSPAVSGELSFDDTTVISIWAYDAVRWCVDNGILNGVGGNRMAPQDLAQRGQVAAMLMRFLQATV